MDTLNTKINYLTDTDLDNPLESNQPLVDLSASQTIESNTLQPLVNTPLPTTSKVPVPLFETEEDRLAFQTYIETTINHILIKENERLESMSKLMDEINTKMNALNNAEDITIQTLQTEIKEKIPDELFQILNNKISRLIAGYSQRLDEEEERFKASIVNADLNYKKLLAMTEQNQKALLEPFSYPYKSIKKIVYSCYGLLFMTLFLLTLTILKR